DRTAVAPVLVGAVRGDAAREAPAANDAGEAAAARRAARVDAHAGLEDGVELDGLTDLPLGGEVGVAAQLLDEALGGLPGLLEEARGGLVGVLLLAVFETEDEGGVAVLLGSAL